MNKLLIPLMLLPVSVLASPMFLDKETTSGVTHLGARHLSLVTGRFLSQDEKKQYFSSYNYGKGNIIRLSDPTGYTIEEDIQAITDEIKVLEEKRVVMLKENLNRVDATNHPTRTTANNTVIEADSSHEETNIPSRIHEHPYAKFPPPRYEEFQRSQSFERTERPNIDHNTTEKTPLNKESKKSNKWSLKKKILVFGGIGTGLAVAGSIAVIVVLYGGPIPSQPPPPNPPPQPPLPGPPK